MNYATEKMLLLSLRGDSGVDHFSFSFEGDVECADFAGADCAGVGCMRAAIIFEVAALLTWQLRS